MIIEMFEHFYDTLFEVGGSEAGKLEEYKRELEGIEIEDDYTPAEIHQLLFENFESPRNFVAKLKDDV